jgi:type VI secretion system protein ImpH
MGAPGRRDRAPLSTRLLEQPYRFDFFQAVRLLERMARERRLPSPGTVGSMVAGEGPGVRASQPVGYEAAPRQEAVRFRALPSLSFPPGAVCEVRQPDRKDVPPDEPLPVEMIVAFMGLTGPQGVLPHHYTAMLISRVRKRDFALRDFFDLFNHRAISLFYRAWEKYRFPIGYERTQLAGAQQLLPSPAAGEGPGVRGRGAAEDLFTQCLFTLVGLGTAGLRRRNQFDDDVFLYYAGLFAHYPRCAQSLEIMLADFFALPTAVRQFQGQWLRLGPDDLSALPSARMPGGLNTHLGTNVVIGERVWNIESKFRIRLGPLNYREFCRFLPSADRLRSLSHLTRNYVGPQFDFDVQLVLKAKEVPWCRLGGDGTDPSRLGWNTWVRSAEFRYDVDDAIFPEQS